VKESGVDYQQDQDFSVLHYIDKMCKQLHFMTLFRQQLSLHIMD